MYAHVSHYLHLVEQGKHHEDALAHTMQRFGVLRPALLETLADAAKDHRLKSDALEVAEIEHILRGSTA